MDSALQLLVHLLTLEDADSEAAEEVYCVFSSCKPRPPCKPLTKSTCLRDVPASATDAENCLNELAWSSRHFITRVIINSMLLKAMVDTGGACSLINLATVQHLGLPYDPATATGGTGGLAHSPSTMMA